ncbi:carboxypeptidase-like regulatory domain-containing protein [Flavobacterium channae]|uniref:carboxypeptidase-like regulatory domain-containing protein n=1 Tax=Flavobacterium channae TaxID=2897181 RepID=UPI001E3F7CF9|nr:carboxypeptidase-like regulatory domain-containing protein [Flavobacterium channae]UGS24497.1 carboxypeptidase-like regulatory domain-containing protein [Flavobacterium channae]
MKKIIYISILFYSILSFGQVIVVSGNVTDAKTGEPLAGAKVLINKTQNGITTDFDGKYSLKTTLNDTLVFSHVGMIMQKVKVDKTEINIELEEEEEIEVVFGPAYYPKPKRLEATTTVSKKDIENAENPKYNFKKNAKNNVFLIFVSELTSYDLNKVDLEFEQKYNVKYSLIGSYKNDYLKKYNKLTFKYLKKKYKKTWLTEIRKDAVGLKKE